MRVDGGGEFDAAEMRRRLLGASLEVEGRIDTEVMTEMLGQTRAIDGLCGGDVADSTACGVYKREDAIGEVAGPHGGASLVLDDGDGQVMGGAVAQPVEMAAATVK